MYVERENMDVMRVLLEVEGLGEETRGIFVSLPISLFLNVSEVLFISPRIMLTAWVAAASSSEGNLQR
jgi:hypothetical protein